MLQMFSRRSSAAALPSNPYDWDLSDVQAFLKSLNPRRSKDRAEVGARLQAVVDAIVAENSTRFPSVESVLAAELQALPPQLRVYREWYEYLYIWLWDA